MSSIPDFNDQALWSRLLDGDRHALDSVYRSHFNSLFQYGMRMLRDEDEVRDCLHDLFVKLWTNRKTIAAARNTNHYLISALRNQIISYRQKRARFDSVEASDDNHFDLNFSLETDYITREDMSAKSKLLAQAMNQLTPRQKEVIYLRYFQDLSFPEIAEIMDLSIKGTYKLSARAMEALRDVLKIDKPLLLLLLLELKQNHFF